MSGDRKNKKKVTIRYMVYVFVRHVAMRFRLYNEKRQCKCISTVNLRI